MIERNNNVIDVENRNQKTTYLTRFCEIFIFDKLLFFTFLLISKKTSEMLSMILIL